MKMNKLFVLILFICIGLFIPKNAFALQVYNNIDVVYGFFAEESDNNKGKLTFKLYDKTKELSFVSTYIEYNNIYSFTSLTNNFMFNSNGVNYGEMRCIDSCSFEDSFRSYVPYSNEIVKINDLDSANEFRQKHGLVGSGRQYYWRGELHQDWNFYTYIPMILEDVNSGGKKIVFASLFVRGELHNNSYYVQVILANYPPYPENNEGNALGTTFLDNVGFMRKATLDYSDELWQELNSGPIASSEINYNKDGHSYINQSISTGEKNVPEETLDDYLDSLPIINLRKESVDEKDSKTDKIIKKLTNPKTWNNGVVVLIISMLVIGGSGYVLIKKKS